MAVKKRKTSTRSSNKRAKRATRTSSTRNASKPKASKNGSAKKRKAKRRSTSKSRAAAKEADRKELIRQHLQEEHQPEGRFLREFTYGAIDGTITTFAVVAGVTGASLSPGIVIIMGFANLVGDGISMACSNYLAEQAEHALIDKERKRERWEVEHIPEAEREEIRLIFKKKGYRGSMLEKAVKVITSNKKLWVDLMMTEELGLTESKKNPLKTAAMTFFGFILIGLIPLVSYVLAYVSPFFAQHTFPIAIVMTAASLFIVGAVKRFFTQKTLWRSALETVTVGGVAAAAAYGIGYALKFLVGVAV